MNREIKFRVWGKLNKKMFNPRYCEYMLSLDGKLFFINDDHPLCLEQKEYELMQYTGLKDSTGKEIYEGDIVKYPDGYCSSNYNIEEVEIISDSIMECEPFNFYNWSENGGGPAKNSSVIGNIFENPELLEAEK